jgi:hypothetical protein
VYFKSSDGRYTGSTYVDSSGGSASVSLTEVTGFPWVAVGMLIIVGGIAGGCVLAWKKGLLKLKLPKSKLGKKAKPSKPAPVKPAVLTCPKCGTKLPPDAVFCPECGNKIKAK